MRIVCKKHLVPQEFVLAFSGGVDSLGAAVFLKKSGFVFKLIHINHKYIPEDDLIADTVAKVAKALELECLIYTNNKELDIKKLGIEGANRQVRIDIFNSLKTDIVLAHHLDDAIESYFLNCLKGQAKHIPIPQKTKLDNGFSLTRPFLLTRKIAFEAIINYNAMSNLVIEDPLNSDLTRKRNWIRKVVLPVIHNEYSGLPKVVAKFYK